MNALAPKWPAAGSHLPEVMKPRPSWRKAGMASLVVEKRMRPSTTRTRSPEARQTQRKIPSARRDPPWSGPFGIPGSGMTSGGLVVIGGEIKRAGSSGDDELVDLGQRRRLDGVGQFGVVDAVGHVLPVGVDELEEGLEGRALR